jgi:hypothetical protein
MDIYSRCENTSHTKGTRMMMSSRTEVVARRLKGLKQADHGWRALCPAHEDTRASLSLGQGNDGRVLLYCHAGCSTDDVLAALELEIGDLFQQHDGIPPISKVQSKIDRIYSYQDEAGNPLYEVVRFDPKDFRHRRNENDWSMKRVERRVPYRLPALLEAIESGRTIFIAEGEKDVGRLAQLGLDATCNSGGANNWLPELSEYLRGANVVILPDNDVPGHQHAQDVAGKLSGIASDVRVLALPGLPPVRQKRGEDVSDWLDLGHTAEDLLGHAANAPVWFPSPPAAIPSHARTLPPPISIRELLEVEEPEHSYIAEPLIPSDANILLAAYPKSGKTFTCLDLAISAVTGSPFLGHFHVSRAHNVGLVLMEDSKYRTKRRLERLCDGKGIVMEDLEGSFHTWFRPPLKISSSEVMAELAEDVVRCDLDLLVIDSWSYVSTGNSNDSDSVTPQLEALSRLREHRPGMSVLLVHHARKVGRDNPGNADRLTDLIRNSSAFGAWYDAGLVLARRDERSPITVRAELRDLPSPESFTYVIDDEQPADPSIRSPARGWLRLRLQDNGPARAQHDGVVAAMKAKVIEYVRTNPGCSKNQLEIGIGGDRNAVRVAFSSLCEERVTRFDPPVKRGQPGRCWLAEAMAVRQAATQLG